MFKMLHWEQRCYTANLFTVSSFATMVIFHQKLANPAFKQPISRKKALYL
jgi:hypothetical protein